MAGSVMVFLAILGGAVFLAAVLKRRVAETVPLSVLFLIAHTYLCGLFGLLRFSVIVTVSGMLLLGAYGLYLSLRKRGRRRVEWDVSLLFFMLGFAWIVYISAGRIPLEQADYTQWALAPKAMFYTNSLTPADGATAFSPALSVFQTVFQVYNALIQPEAGYAEWLPYVACGTACLSLLLPFARCAHPRRWVRTGYSLLFFLTVLCIPLQAFGLFSALNPDGFLAILAAASVLAAAQKKSTVNAVAVGLYLFVLTLAKDAGLFFSLSALAVYMVTLLRCDKYRQAARTKRAVLTALPAALVLLARLTWLRLSFTLHEANAGVFSQFWQSLTAKLFTYRVGLGGATLFTLHVSVVALAVLLGVMTALLVRAMRTRPALRNAKTALSFAPGIAALFAVGLWLIYLFAVEEADAAKLVNFQRFISVGTVFWMLLAAASAFRVQAEAGTWTWRRHLLIALACACVILPCGDTLGGLTSREFTADNDRYHTYYAVAGEAQLVIPEDARVYIVSQNDDGSVYNTLRYALYPRRTNLGKTYWLSDPEQKPNDWAYPVTAADWKTSLSEYDYVLVYRTDNYLQTTIAAVVTEGSAIEANTIYRVDQDTGLLTAAE